MTRPRLISIFYEPPTWEFILVGLISGLALFLLDLDSQGRVDAIAISFGAIVMSIRILWPLRKRIWFILLMMLIVAAHVWAIIAVRWPDAKHVMGATLIPFVFADFIAILGTVCIVYSLLGFVGVEKAIEDTK